MKLAEDAVQETFMAIWRRPETFDPDRGSARTWLYSIVRHRAIDIARGRFFTQKRVSLETLSFEPRYPDVWQEVSVNLSRERVRQVVDDLPPEQREAVMLAYFGGHSQREISERTGVPLGTVKGRMRLGLQKLRSALVSSEPGEQY